MFKNSFEELLFLRFLSKNAEHQRKMNQKMLNTQQELVELKKQKSIKINSNEKNKADIASKASDKKYGRIDLADVIEGFNPFKKGVTSDLKPINVFFSILLTLILGPVGLLYSSIKFAAVMTAIFIIAVIIRMDYTIGWFLINTIIVSIGIYQTLKWNKNLKKTEINSF